MTCDGVQSGCCCMMRAAMPAICAVAMEVPESVWNDPASPTAFPGAAPMRATPGAMMSGLKISLLGSL
ncbi:hypothetical protein CLOP_g2740 [Closterium sp. NIES-67]|nr:hypothetical protein CLOP_g2740 [Closterium sp. NIES-67]